MLSAERPLDGRTDDTVPSWSDATNNDSRQWNNVIFEERETSSSEVSDRPLHSALSFYTPLQHSAASSEMTQKPIRRASWVPMPPIWQGKAMLPQEAPSTAAAHDTALYSRTGYRRRASVSGNNMTSLSSPFQTASLASMLGQNADADAVAAAVALACTPNRSVKEEVRLNADGSMDKSLSLAGLINKTLEKSESSTDAPLTTGSNPVTGTRTLQCTYAGCGKEFLQLAHLRIHERIHTGERPFVCAYADCGKSFSQLGNLKTHARKHTGERPFQCTFPGCTKWFSQLGNLRTHERMHSGERPYSCPVVDCGRTFTQLGNLKTHVSKVHTSHDLEALSCYRRRPYTRKSSLGPMSVADVAAAASAALSAESPSVPPLLALRRRASMFSFDQQQPANTSGPHAASLLSLAASSAAYASFYAEASAAASYGLPTTQHRSDLRRHSMAAAVERTESMAPFASPMAWLASASMRAVMPHTNEAEKENDDSTCASNEQESTSSMPVVMSSLTLAAPVTDSLPPTLTLSTPALDDTANFKFPRPLSAEESEENSVTPECGRRGTKRAKPLPSAENNQ